MLALLLLQTATPQTAIEAERAFARAAQARGQWTAFREFLTDDAIIFTPQPVKAKEALPEKNPPIAVQWWPAESYVSCDGTTAINTGPWVRPKAGGYFTTVWLKQTDGGWKWSLDHGDALAKPRTLPERPVVRRAGCGGKPYKIQYEPCPEWIRCMTGNSPDGTLLWSWTVMPDGSRGFDAKLWNGHGFDDVIQDRVAAPAK